MLEQKLHTLYYMLIDNNIFTFDKLQDMQKHVCVVKCGITVSFTARCHSSLSCINEYLDECQQRERRINLLLMFYNEFISSTISFGAACWGGHVSKHDQGRVDKDIHRASRIFGRHTTSSLCIEGKCYLKLC